MDHISTADDNNDKCKLLNEELPTIGFSGGGTFTAGALKEAKVYCDHHEKNCSLFKLDCRLFYRRRVDTARSWSA